MLNFIFERKYRSAKIKFPTQYCTCLPSRKIGQDFLVSLLSCIKSMSDMRVDALSPLLSALFKVNYFFGKKNNEL